MWPVGTPDLRDMTVTRRRSRGHQAMLVDTPVARILVASGHFDGWFRGSLHPLSLVLVPPPANPTSYCVAATPQRGLTSRSSKHSRSDPHTRPPGGCPNGGWSFLTGDDEEVVPGGPDPRRIRLSNPPHGSHHR